MLNVFRLPLAAMLGVSIAVFSHTAVAQTEAIDLTGKWVMQAGEVAHWSGELRPYGERDSVVLIVEEQLGGVFKGTIVYETNPEEPEFQGRAGLGHVLPEPIFGVVDWDDETVFWVDYEDQTIHRGRLKDENTMEVIAIEPGDHTVANRTILVRE